MALRHVFLAAVLVPLLTACPASDGPIPPAEVPSIEISATTLQMTVAAGSAAQSQTVNIGNGGGGTLAWSAVSNAGWVGVSPSSGSVAKGQSGTTTVTINPAGLSAATHNATITISASEARNGPQTINISLVVTPAPTLSVPTASLSFTAQAGTNPPAQVVSVANDGGGVLNWNASESLPWLTLSPASGSLSAAQSASVAVAVATAGLSAGTYNGTITVTAPGVANSPRSVAITLTINPAPSIGVSATSLTFTAQEGANPPDQTLTISNTGGGTLEWTASEPMPWVVGSPATGSLSAGQSAGMNLSVNTVGLQPGTYAGAVTISAPGAANSPQSIPVSLVVTAAPLPALAVSPAALTFSAQQGSNPAGQTLTISNTGAGTLTWTASEPIAWLVGAPASGALSSGQSASATFTVNTAGLGSGTYSGTITVTAPGAANSPRSVPVTLTVSAAPAVLEVTPASLSYSGQPGSSPPAQTFTITNSGGSTLSWSASESLSWLTLSSSSGNIAAGASTSVTATVNTAGLTANTYSGAVSVTAAGATGSPKTISISLALTATVLPAPTLASPADGATGVARSPTLGWNAVSGANQYWVTIATTQAALPTNPSASTCPGCVVSVNTSGTSLTVSTSLAAGTTYYWRVQGYNNSTAPITQGQFSAIRSFGTTSPAPVFRIDGGTSSTRPIGETFILSGSGFTPNGTATRYVREPSGTEVNIGAVSVSASGTIGWSFPPVCTTALGTYTLWVVDNATNLSSNTVTETVTSSPSCSNLLPAPTLNSPSNGATGVSTTPTFTWSAVAGANRYWLLIATNQTAFPSDPNASACPGCTFSGYTGATSLAPTSPLASGTGYYWRVQGFNNSTSPFRQGQYSEIRHLTTQAAQGYKMPLPGSVSWLVSAGIGASNHVGSDYYAIDFPAGGRTNVRILAAGSGVIDGYRWDVPNPAAPQCPAPDAGNYVRIRHPDGTYTAYFHLAHNTIPSHLREIGRSVSQGEQIGIMGRTGCTAGATGIHLHFRVNAGSRTGTSTALRDFVVDGRRLADYHAGASYVSSNSP